MSDVFINEIFVGFVDDSKKFIEEVKTLRRKGDISKTLNLTYNEDFDEIQIETSAGRARRPLIIVDDGKPRLTEEHVKKIKAGEMTWKDLVENSIIEYIDSTEEENIYVALSEEDLTKEHTHLEISPITIVGLITSLVPYSNYGSLSRLIRGSKIQKQALGLYASNFLIRVDSDVSILHYPQVPLVKSFMHDVFKYEKHPSGQNFTIAVMSYEGYNMQDSIILNKGSIERGLARSSFFSPNSIEELRYSGGLQDEICIPDKETKGYKTEKDYRFLEKDGIAFPEAQLNEEDVIIGKTSPPRFLGGLEEFSVAASVRRESSTTVKHGDSGVVDFVILTENGEGNKLVKVRMREQRIPEIGDKFSSRHGQKGVIGLIIPEEDVPFTSTGIKPDIIFSPHSIPSRMTMSHLLEVMAGKVGALTGSQIDSTTFDCVSEEELRETLLKYGFKENGTETMYNPFNGRVYHSKIYVGNMYYLKLKHMVANKIHSRATGRIQLLTRQPIEGRARGGGLRLGEMEKDCLVAHGASLLLKERFDSDKTIMYICDKCGMIAMFDYYKNAAVCPKCGANIETSAVELSYAFKLLLDELRSLGVNPEIRTKSKY